MSNDKPKPQMGAGHWDAMKRLGLAELRAAVVFSESNIVQPPPYGIFGTKTPGEVQDELKASVREADDKPGSVFEGRLNDKGSEGKDDGRESPEIEME
jgi:hypothetical protein